MARKSKTFDCVEMKWEAQSKLMAEYEARKNEFASYWEFLQSKSRESAWQTALLKKSGRSSHATAK